MLACVSASELEYVLTLLFCAVGRCSLTITQKGYMLRTELLYIAKTRACTFCSRERCLLDDCLRVLEKVVFRKIEHASSDTPMERAHCN